MDGQGTQRKAWGCADPSRGSSQGTGDPACLQEMCAHEPAGAEGEGGMLGQGQSCLQQVLGEGVLSIRVGLIRAYLQGAYGVVRLAYNESEDRHYVSLGEEGGIAKPDPRCLGKVEVLGRQRTGCLLGEWVPCL